MFSRDDRPNETDTIGDADTRDGIDVRHVAARLIRNGAIDTIGNRDCISGANFTQYFAVESNQSSLRVPTPVAAGGQFSSKEVRDGKNNSSVSAPTGTGPRIITRAIS